MQTIAERDAKTFTKDVELVRELLSAASVLGCNQDAMSDRDIAVYLCHAAEVEDWEDDYLLLVAGYARKPHN